MRRKTHEEFVEEMSRVRPDIKVIGTYTIGHSKIEFECKKCGHRWMAMPYAILQNHGGCPKCSKHRNRTHEEFIEELETINKNIIVKSKFKNTSTKVSLECKVCGNEWSCEPQHLLRGVGCPKCSAIRGGKLQSLGCKKKFMDRLSAVNKDIIVLSEYKKATEKVKCQCKICGHIWYATPYNLLNNHGCPRCTVSKGEKRIGNYLSDNNVSFESPKKFQDLKGVNDGLLSYDFYLKEHNLLIEYQGIQHSEPVNYTGRGMEYSKQKLKIQKEHDKRKRDYARKNGINLLEIWYYDFDNVEAILDKEINKVLEKTG